MNYQPKETDYCNIWNVNYMNNYDNYTKDTIGDKTDCIQHCPGICDIKQCDEKPVSACMFQKDFPCNIYTDYYEARREYTSKTMEPLRSRNDPFITDPCQYNIKNEINIYTNCLWAQPDHIPAQQLRESKHYHDKKAPEVTPYKSECGVIYVEVNGVTYDIDTQDRMEDQFHNSCMQSSHSQTGSIYNDVSILPKTIDNDASVYKHGVEPKYRGKLKVKRKHKAYSDNQPKQKRLPRGCRLWEFLRGLLLNRDYNPSHIKWINRTVGEFKLVKSAEIARMWGEQKNNPGMTYEKLSRAMRYYYKRQILAPVLGKRLIYRFASKSYGWEEA